MVLNREKILAALEQVGEAFPDLIRGTSWEEDNVQIVIAKRIDTGLITLIEKMESVGMDVFPIAGKGREADGYVTVEACPAKQRHSQGAGYYIDPMTALREQLIKDSRSTAPSRFQPQPSPAVVLPETIFQRLGRLLHISLGHILEGFSRRHVDEPHITPVQPSAWSVQDDNIGLQIPPGRDRNGLGRKR